ncbi:hypothetical protein QQX98_007277 [Neonectria punicea]|uniref:Ankyrin n=1 Tax=Neonectria punicea TaxID=979145 RepID=A0ABR1GYG1_9HYPO
MTTRESIRAWRDLLQRSYHADRLTWFHLATKNNLSMAQDLLDSNQRYTTNFSYENCPIPNPLIEPIEDRNKELVVVLLEAGADVNEHNLNLESSRSPLQSAVEVGDLGTVDYLLKAGAEVNAPPAKFAGGTALQLAAIKGYLGLAKLLLDLGAHATAMPSPRFGRSAIEGAAEHKRLDMVEFLLHHGDFATGIGRRQYVKAVKRAATMRHHAIEELLRGYRDWMDEDEELFNDENLLDEDDWLKFWQPTGYGDDKSNEQNSEDENDGDGWDESEDEDGSEGENEVVEEEGWIPTDC